MESSLEIISLLAEIRDELKRLNQRNDQIEVRNLKIIEENKKIIEKSKKDQDVRKEKIVDMAATLPKPFQELLRNFGNLGSPTK